MSRRRTYGRKKRINFLPIIIVLLVVIIIVAIGIKIFSANDNISQIDEILSSDLLKTAGTISSSSSVDTKVYSNDGIKYTNKHENIIRIDGFNSSLPEDLEKVQIVKTMLEKLGDLEEAETVKELSPKQNGYYWIDINLTAEGKMLLIFNNEEEYNIDLYYDISEQKIYIKNKYYNEFSNKNNKVKLQGFKVNEEYKSLIEKLAMVNQ